MASLLRSQLQCPFCDDIIASISRHDFRTCRCGALSIDGGLDYLRIAYDGRIAAKIEAEGSVKGMDRSISISGEHNRTSKIAALVVYKALWLASNGGQRPVTAAEVTRATRMVGNGRGLTPRSVSAYLSAFADDEGPVERLGQRSWKPLVPLADRADAL